MRPRHLLAVVILMQPEPALDLARWPFVTAKTDLFHLRGNRKGLLTGFKTRLT